jgi:hypothetical protein
MISWIFIVVASYVVPQLEAKIIADPTNVFAPIVLTKGRISIKLRKFPKIPQIQTFRDKKFTAKIQFFPKVLNFHLISMFTGKHGCTLDGRAVFFLGPTRTCSVRFPVGSKFLMQHKVIMSTI